MVTLIFLFALSCGGGGGGSTSSDPTSLEGSWLLVNDLDSSTCNVEGTSESFPIFITQNGSSIDVQASFGGLEGTATATNASWTGQYFHKDLGLWITISSMDIEYSSIAFSGSAAWQNRVDMDGPVICSGTSLISGGRPGVPVPASPSGLTAVGTSSTQISLNWSDNAANEDGFKIYSLTGYPYQRTIIASVGANTTNNVVDGLLPNTDYRFEVLAYNSIGESLPADSAAGRTQASGVSPPATPGNVEAAPWSKDTVRVSWEDNSADETQFRIYRGLSPGTVNSLVGSAPADTLHYDDPGLATGVPYYYQVRAHNDAGGDSAPSSVVNTTLISPDGLYDYSLYVQVSVPNCNGIPGGTVIPVSGSMTIEETAANNLIYRGTGINLSSTYVYNTTRYVILGLSGTMSTPQGPILFNGIPLEAQLDWEQINEIATVPVVFNGCSSAALVFSLSRTSSTLPPAGPTGLAANPVSSSRIDLTWTDHATDEDSYVIYRGTTGASLAAVATLGAGAQGYSDTGLPPETTRYYQVRARKGNELSDPSATVSATTEVAPVIIPSPPSGLTATPRSGTAIELNWSDGSNNESGFKIYRGGSPSSLSFLVNTRSGVTSYRDSSATPGSTFHYQVSAFNSAGESTRTAVVPASTPAGASVPTAPSSLTATALSATEIYLAWADKSDDEDGFSVYRSQGCTASYSSIGTLPANSTWARSYSLTPSTTYCYKIKSYNGVGESTTFSNTASDTTLISGTTAPEFDTFYPTYDNLIHVSDQIAGEDDMTYPDDDLAVGNNFSHAIDPVSGAQIACFKDYWGSLLYFDVDSNISGKTINVATLKLYPYIAPTAGPASYSVNAIAGDWNPTTIAWSSSLALDGFYWVEDAATTPSILNNTTNPLVWDVTAIVQNWADGYWTNYGLVVSDLYNPPYDACPDNADFRGTAFWSSEYYDSTFVRPKLFIEWE